MNETPSSDNTVLVNQRHLCRLHRLVVASLCLNGLIVLFILLCICHQHRMMQRGDFGRGGGWGQQERGCGGFHHHHRFMDRGGWGRQENFRGGDKDREDGRPHFGGMDRDKSEGGRGMGGEGKGFGMGMGMDRGMGMKGQAADPARMTDAIVAHLTQQLTLTDDQKAKIKPIISQQVVQFQKEEEARRAAMQKEIADGLNKIKPILNADQQKQLDALPIPGRKAAEKPAAETAPAKE